MTESPGSSASPLATTPEGPVVPPSRAGRNLPAAITVGIVLGALIIGCLFWRKELFLVLATASLSIGVWEIVTALRAQGVRVPIVPALIGCIAQMVVAFLYGAQALGVTFLLAVALLVMWRGSEPVPGAAADVTHGVLATAYPALLGGFAMLMLASPDGAWRTFTFVAVTVASDIGGYAVGVLVGRHPMAPSISPKKSWEGFLGSVLFCMLIGVVCVTFTPVQGPWWAGLILGALLAPAATLGDLAESALKRDIGIKDMSSILPGHGGMMDRLDSLVVAAPVCWLVLTVLVPSAGGFR